LHFATIPFSFAIVDLLRTLRVIRDKVLSMHPTDPFLRAAIQEARQGLEEGGIPIGSIIVHSDKVHGDKIIGRGHNRRMQKGSAILHGEMDALENAGRQSAAVYRECILYTTLSPCSMCSGAILLYGIPRIVIGENRTFMGEEDLLRARGVSIQVVQSDECIQMMKEFIQKNPALWNEDIGV
jgi:cytosine/creatinine deaminase